MQIADKVYASIWRRIVAYLVDYVISFAVLIPLQYLVSIVTRGFPYNLFKTGLQIELWILLTVSLPVWLYFIFSEQSTHQATFGKRLLRVRVTRVSGERMSFAQAVLRTAIKLLPWELTHLSLMLPVPMWWDPTPNLRVGIVIAYVLVGVYVLVMLLNRRRQSVHDMIAQTVVVETGK